MLAVVLAGVGVVGGFVWQKRRRRRAGGTLGGQGDGDELHGAAAVVLAGSRRAFITSLILLRSSTALAFRRTAKHYAPVPLTFTAAVLSALPSIFGTAFSINLVVVNGVSMAGLFLRRQAPDEGGRLADIARLTSCCAGVVGFVVFQRRWENSPLRGSLSVFGRDPKLDRCASAERYLVEKLALLANAGYRRVASLSQLVSAGRATTAGPAGASEPEAAAPLANYASQVVGLRWGGALAEVDGVFSEYCDRYIATHQEMSVLADKLRYPEAVRRLEPALSKASDALMAPLRAKNAAKDIADKLAELRRELGDQIRPMAMLMMVNLAGGVFLGVELARLPWLRDL